MKKVFIIIVVVFTGIFCDAQNTKIYARIDLVRKSTTGKYSIILNFENLKLKEQSKYEYADGSPLSFTSFLDAMNYMSQQGWQLEHPYVYSLGTGAIISAENCWIISKEVDFSEIMSNVCAIDFDEGKKIKPGKH